MCNFLAVPSALICEVPEGGEANQLGARKRIFNPRGVRAVVLKEAYSPEKGSGAVGALRSGGKIRTRPEKALRAGRVRAASPFI